MIGRSDSPHVRLMERLAKIADSPPNSLTSPCIIIELDGDASPRMIVLVIGCTSTTMSDRTNTCDTEPVER